MSDSVLLTSNIRSNLLALQNTASMLATAQERLSTGKKVNSALDNATAYFTSQSLSDRASNLQNLLDGIGNGLSTIKAANQGLQTITSLLKSAKAIAQQALSGSGGTTNYSATSTTAQTTGTGSTPQAKALDSLLTAAGNGIAAADTLTFTSVDTNNVSKTFTFTVGAGSKVTDLVDAVNASGVGTAKVNDNGTLSFNSTGNLSITSSDNTQTSILGITATAGVISTTAGSTSTGVDRTSQFNDLLDSVDQTATDSNYNGINLLLGGASNKLSVKLDDVSASKLEVDSEDVTTTGLTLTKPTTLDASNAQTFIDSIDAAIGKIQSLQSAYGTKQTILQARQDFTSNIVTTLKSGSDALVTADTNEEAANVLALQTRQSLSQSALSLANQANQAVLQLLR
jgi:flagellin-like hook-associated protein FlgL